MTAMTIDQRAEALRQHPSAEAVVRGRYDPTKSLGERLHASYREALGHLDGDRSNFSKLPADDQAFWNRAAVNFVARLSS